MSEGGGGGLKWCCHFSRFLPLSWISLPQIKFRAKASSSGCELREFQSILLFFGEVVNEINEYSQTCELRPPKGLGISGPISQVVSFARFGSKIFNTELHMPLHEPATSAIGSPHVYAGAWLATTMPSGARKRDDRSFGVPAKEKLDYRKVFFPESDVCGRFSQVKSALWADLQCPQFAFLRWSQFQERTPYI